MKFICGPWGEGAASWNHCSLNKKGNIHYTVNRIIWTKEQWMHIRFAVLPLQFYSTTHPAQKMVVFSWYCAHDNTCCNHTLLRQSNTYYILHYILLYICTVYEYLPTCFSVTPGLASSPSSTWCTGGPRRWSSSGEPAATSPTRSSRLPDTGTSYRYRRVEH